MIDKARRPRVIQVVLVLMLVVATAGAGVLVWQQATKVVDDHRADAARAQVVAIATAQVLDLTTLDAKSLNAHLKALGERSTGQFKTQLSSLSNVFTSIIGKQDVVSRGTITGAGVVSISATKAQVLVSASAAVTQKASATPRSQRYRMNVDLTKASGKWLISGMEFVA